MNDKLRNLRIKAKMTQEGLAERMNVSRQSIAKWENGDSVPDIIKCGELAKIFDLSIEDIADIFTDTDGTKAFKPKNKYIFGKCVITNNTIVIPDEALKVFGLKNGDELVLLGDSEQGLGLTPITTMNEFVQEFVNAPTLGGVKNNENNY